MKSTPRPFIAACAVLGVVIGYAIGAWFFSRNPARQPSASDSAMASHSSAPASEIEDARFASDDVAIGAVFTAWQHKNPLRRGKELKDALDRLDATQFAQMVERVSAFETEEMYELLIALVRQWTLQNPKAAAAWARPAIERQFAGARVGTDWATISAWSFADPEAAIALALERPEASASQNLVTDAVGALAQDDPAGQLDRMAALPAGRLREAAISAALTKLAQTDPSGALARLDELPPGARRDSAQTSILIAWAQNDPTGALAETGRRIEAGELGRERGDLSDTIRVAAEVDPAAALKWTETLPEDLRFDAATIVAGSWAAKDPTAALDWAIANGLALDKASSLGGGYWSGRSILERALATNSTKTIEWVRAQPASAERTRLLTQSVGNAPVELSREIFNELPPDFQFIAAPTVAYQIADSGIDDAVSWTKELAAGSVREHAITGMVGILGRRANDQLDSLLEQYPVGADRDAALRGAVQASWGKQTQGLSYAQSISDPAIREQAFRQVASSWLNSEPAAARVWLDGTNELSPDVKKMLVRSATENRLGY
ncbi:MAG: hypothetical protein ABI680_01690 [Chthoniobacteraceae bacterium]